LASRSLTSRRRREETLGLVIPFLRREEKERGVLSHLSEKRREEKKRRELSHLSEKRREEEKRRTLSSF